MSVVRQRHYSRGGWK